MTAIPGSAARGYCVAEAFTFPSPRTTLKPEERALPPARLQLRRPDSRLGTVGWPRSGPRFLAAPSIPAFDAIGARGFTAALINVWPARSDAISAAPGAGRWEEARALIQHTPHRGKPLVVIQHPRWIRSRRHRDRQHDVAILLPWRLPHRPAHRLHDVHLAVSRRHEQHRVQRRYVNFHYNQHPRPTRERCKAAALVILTETGSPIDTIALPPETRANSADPNMRSAWRSRTADQLDAVTEAQRDTSPKVHQYRHRRAARGCRAIPTECIAHCPSVYFGLTRVIREIATVPDNGRNFRGADPATPGRPLPHAGRRQWQAHLRNGPGFNGRIDTNPHGAQI